MFDKEGNAIATNLDKINGKIKETRESAIRDSESSYKTLQGIIKSQYTGDSKVIKKLPYEDSIQKNVYDKINKSDNSAIFTMTEEYKYFLELQTKGIVLSQNQQDEYKGIRKILEESNDFVANLYKNKSDISKYNVFDFDKGEMVNAKKYYDDLAKGEDGASDSAKELKTSTGELVDGLKSTEEQAKATENSIKDMSDSFSKASDNISLLKTAMTEFNTTGGKLSDETISKMLSTGDSDIISLLGNSNTFMEKATQLSKRYSDSQKENLENAIKLANGEKLVTTDSTNIKATQYGIDVINKSNAENAKAKGTDEINNAMIKNNAVAQDVLGKQYGTDVINKIIAENSKGKAVNDTNNGILSSNANATNQLANIYKNDSENFKKAQKEKMDTAYSSTSSMWDKFSAISDINSAEKNKTIADLKPPDNNTKSTYTPVMSSYTPIGISDKSASELAKENKEAEKTVANLESLYDRYLNLNQVLNSVKATVSSYEIAMKNLHGQNHIDYIKKEIEAYKQEQNLISSNIDELKRERNEKESLLISNGFIIDSMGRIANYQAQLNYLTNRANSLSGDSKESAIENVKKLSEATKEYSTLVSNSIPKMDDEWQSLTNTIQETYKTMQKLVVDAESKITEVIKDELTRRTNAKIDALDKEKKLLDDKNKSDTYADTLQESQTKVTDYDSKIMEAIKSRDKEAIKSLTQAKQEAMDELNKTIQDHEQEAVSNKFDEEKQKLQDNLTDLTKPENMTKLISESMANGFINVNGEVIKLSDAMDNFLKNSVSGVQSLKSEMSDLINILNDGVSALGNVGMSNIKNPTLDGTLFNGNVLNTINTTIPNNVSSNSGGHVLNVTSPLVHIDRVDSSNMDELSTMMDGKINYLVKNLMDNSSM